MNSVLYVVQIIIALQSYKMYGLTIAPSRFLVQVACRREMVSDHRTKQCDLTRGKEMELSVMTTWPLQENLLSTPAMYDLFPTLPPPIPSSLLPPTGSRWTATMSCVDTILFV